MKVIKYKLDGGEIAKGEELVTEWTERSPRIPPIPSKEGYVFKKWVDDRGRRIMSLDPSKMRDGMVITAYYTKVEVPSEEKGVSIPHMERKRDRKLKEESVTKDLNIEEAIPAEDEVLDL